MPPAHYVGQTIDAGYQFGIRRTVDVSPAAAWEFLLSSAGLHCWLGDIHQISTEVGSPFQTADGVFGKIRARKPGSHLRLDWQAADRKAPSILQVRVLSAGKKATISFHLERLEDQNHRLEMIRQWSDVMEQIAKLIK